MQTINRNNYEEFFLLYVDGELKAGEQLAVENFVQQNPDLAVELEMLLKTKLTPEAIEFDNKENLIRTEGNSINETNYEEYFLLYIDNELSAAKREEVEMYVLKHPQLQDVFITLKQAVLTPELISYGDKQNLYRKERRRILYLKPWRFAAAAVFIGVCAIGLWMMQRADNTIDVAVNLPAQGEPANTVPQTVVLDTVKQAPEQPVDIAQQPSAIKEEKKTPVITAASKKKDNNVVAQKAINIAPENAEKEVVAKRPVIIHNNIVKEQKEPPVDIHKVTAAVPEDFSSKQIDVAALQTPEINTEAQNNNRVYPVAYKEINTNDDDRSLHVGMLDLNKDKVRTLFKKAGRMFGGKPNDPTDRDGKLQVANFEIDTKNNN